MKRAGLSLLVFFVLAATAASAKTLTVCDVLVNLPKLARPHKPTRLSAGVRGIGVVEYNENKRNFLVAEKPCDPRPTPGLYRRPESIELVSGVAVDYWSGGDIDPVTGDPWFSMARHRKGLKNIVVVHGNLSFVDEWPGRGCSSEDWPLRTVLLTRETNRVVSTTPYSKDDLSGSRASRRLRQI